MKRTLLFSEVLKDFYFIPVHVKFKKKIFQYFSEGKFGFVWSEVKNLRDQVQL